MADTVLTKKPYNEKRKSVTWEKKYVKNMVE